MPQNNTNTGLDCVGTEFWDSLSAIPGGRLDLDLYFLPFLALRNNAGFVWAAVYPVNGRLCVCSCQFSSA